MNSDRLHAGVRLLTGLDRWLGDGNRRATGPWMLGTYGTATMMINLYGKHFVPPPRKVILTLYHHQHYPPVPERSVRQPHGAANSQAAVERLFRLPTPSPAREYLAG